MVSCNLRLYFSANIPGLQRTGMFGEEHPADADSKAAEAEHDEKMGR
jgi:hypothetical protein